MQRYLMQETISVTLRSMHDVIPLSFQGNLVGKVLLTPLDHSSPRNAALQFHVMRVQLCMVNRDLHSV